MRKSSKKAKKKVARPDLTVTPSYCRFCDKTYDGEVYKWQSWGLVIRHLREYTGMDQAVFGRLLKGYTRAQISRYETEAAEPPIDFWIKLMKTFGLDLNWALTGEGVPYNSVYIECEEMNRLFEWIALISDKENFLKDLMGDE